MKITLVIGILLLFIGTVFAQGIPPPAPQPELPVRIVNCSDSDGGINYYESGIFTYEVIKWTDNSYSFQPPENIDSSRDYCKRSVNDKEGDCNHPEKSILVESYCTKPEIDLAKENAESFKEYDCTSEGKVCYDGICITKDELNKNPKYLKEKAECNKQLQEHLSFWRKFYFWFLNPSGKVDFSETNIEVKNSEGIAIEGVKVTFSSNCRVGDFASSVQTQEGITDSKGKLKFKEFELETNYPKKYCKKSIGVYKEGFCPFTEGSQDISYLTCLRELENNNFSNLDIVYYADAVTIKPNENKVNFILKKYDPNFDYSSEISSLEEYFNNKPLEVASRE